MAATGNLSSAQFNSVDSDALDPTPVPSERAENSNYGWGGGTSNLANDGDMDVPGALKGTGADFYSDPGVSGLHGGSGDAKVTVAEKNRRLAENTGDTDYSRADLPSGAPKYDQRALGAEHQLQTSGLDIWGRKAA